MLETSNIFQRVKLITNLHDDDVTFLESDGVKYKEDLALILSKDILKKNTLITQRKTCLVCEYLTTEDTETNANTKIQEIQVAVMNQEKPKIMSPVIGV